MGYFLFTEYNSYGSAYTEFAFDGKLCVRNSADVLDDGRKTKTGSADTLGMGFVHAIEALAKKSLFGFWISFSCVMSVMIMIAEIAAEKKAKQA